MTAILNRRAVMGVARHGLTALGGYLVAMGYADPGTADALTGGGVALVGVVWSILDKT